jgi:hypothetical protein
LLTDGHIIVELCTEISSFMGSLKTPETSEFSVYFGYLRMLKKTSKCDEKRLQKDKKWCLLYVYNVIFITRFTPG